MSRTDHDQMRIDFQKRDPHEPNGRALSEMSREQRLAKMRAEDAAFDTDHPGVYLAFVAEARAVKAQGFDHYSARTIVHVLRHHSAVRDGSGEFKINDHISPILARRLMRDEPSFVGWFELRERKTNDTEAA